MTAADAGHKRDATGASPPAPEPAATSGKQRAQALAKRWIEMKTKLETDARAAVERIHSRWDTTVVVQPDFDPVSGVLDDKALRQRIAADHADAAKLKAMAHFQKPGDVKDYVKRVTERAP